MKAFVIWAIDIMGLCTLLACILDAKDGKFELAALHLIGAMACFICAKIKRFNRKLG
jgi:hypothetical protein